MTFLKADLEELVKTKVNERNFLTFSKLLSLQNSDNYRKVIDLLFNNFVNCSDLENLPMIDDIEIRKFLASYESNISFNYDNKVILNSTFSVRDYMYRSSSPVLQKLKELNEEVNQKGDYTFLSLDSPTVSVSSYSSIQEARNEFKEKVIPELKKYLNTSSNISSVISSLQSYLNDIPDAFEKEVSLKIFESLFGFNNFKEKFNDEDLFDVLLNTFQDFSLMSQSNFKTDFFFNARTDISTFRKLFSEACMNLALQNKKFESDYLVNLKSDILSSSDFDVSHSSLKLTIITFKNLLYRYVSEDTGILDSMNLDPHLSKIIETKDKVKDIMFYTLNFLVTKYMRVMY